MNNSLIISFFIRLYSLFCEGYETSVFKKICDFFKNPLKKSADKSRIVSFFSKRPNLKTLESSVFYKVFVSLFCKLKSIIKKIIDYSKKSLIISEIIEFFDNIFVYSTSVYGYFVIFASAAYMIMLKSSDALTKKGLIILSGLLLIGILIILINRSLSSLFSNSKLAKFAFSYFEIDLEGVEETKKCPKYLYVVFSLAGILSGIIAAKISPLYAVLLPAGLFFVCMVLYNYKTAVYLLPVILPFAPTMALVGLILLGFASFLVKAFGDDDFKFKKTSVDMFLIAFALISVVSAITSVSQRKSIQILLVYLVFISAYFLITNAITTKKDLYAVILFALLSALAVGLYGIYQYIFGFDEGLVWIDNDMFSDIETRVVSTFENPNVLGEYLLLMIPIAMAYLWNAPKGFTKFSQLCVAGVLSLCMIFTYSRGNWVGLIVAVCLYFAFYDRKFIWFGIGVLLISPAFLPENIINRFLSIGDTKDTSTSYRVNIWFGTLKMLKDYWLVGIGQGEVAFSYVYSKYSYAGITAPHAHNLYLQLITEHGVMGLIIFFGIIISYYKNVISAIVYKKHSFLKALIIGLSAGMMGYLIQGLFDNVFYNYRIVLMFFVITGLTGAAVNCFITDREDADV